MQTTLTIDEELLAQAKKEAARSGRTLDAVVEDALREALARESQSARASGELPVATTARLRPDVSPEDIKKILDREDVEHFLRVMNDQSRS